MFWKLTPKTLRIYQSEYIKREQARIKDADAVAYQTGLYVRQAIVSAFNSKCQYPSKPNLQDCTFDDKRTNKPTDGEEYTEEQKEELRKKLYAQLRVTEINNKSKQRMEELKTVNKNEPECQ